MNEIFEPMRTLLFIAIDRDDWVSPANRATIESALGALHRRADGLGAHGNDANVSFAFYSHQLAEGAAQMQSNYRDGQYELARNQLFHLVDTCVACHSRLPSLKNSALSERFAADSRVRALPIEERARLEVATRRFDAALRSYEAMIRSPEFTPRDLDLLGILDDYLTVCFQVRSDRERPRRTLEALRARPDISEDLAADVQRWLDTLATLPSFDEAPKLEEARLLIARAQGVGNTRKERNALLDYLAASAFLYRVVEDTDRPASERAEAYYLLAIAESAVGRAFWPAPEEAYLESAIRLAPHSDTSMKAFDLLEELVGLGYTGSGGMRIPSEVEARLAELRLLASPDTLAPNAADG